MSLQGENEKGPIELVKPSSVVSGNRTETQPRQTCRPICSGIHKLAEKPLFKVLNRGATQTNVACHMQWHTQTCRKTPSQGIEPIRNPDKHVVPYAVAYTNQRIILYSKKRRDPFPVSRSQNRLLSHKDGRHLALQLPEPPAQPQGRKTPSSASAGTGRSALRTEDT
jgi:hypothetical protein